MNELERSLSALPTYDPDRSRLNRVREDCRTALGQRSSRRRVESTVVIGASGAYLAGVIRTALLLYGF